MRGLNLKEIMSKFNMNQQGLNIATYGQAYYRENEKSDIRLMNLPFTSALKNTAQTQSSTNWNLTLKSPKFTVFKERFFGPPFNFAHEITHKTFLFFSITFYLFLFVCCFFSSIFWIILCVYISHL